MSKKMSIFAFKGKSGCCDFSFLLRQTLPYFLKLKKLFDYAILKTDLCRA